jgi:hypothetical protein
MKLNALLKGLFMGVIGLIATIISDHETINLAYVIITTVVFTGQYLVKNWLMPSITEKLTIDTRDFISGILSALFMGISVYAATLLTEVEFTWIALWKAVVVAFVGYFAKTLPSAKK